MTKTPLIFLWSTRRSFWTGLSLWFVCYWAYYAYPNYNHLWYYWPFFTVFIGISALMFLQGFSLVRLTKTRVTLYRFFTVTSFDQLTLNYGQKEKIGHGIQRVTHWPITFSGLAVDKKGQLTDTTHQVIAGKLALKQFKTVCAKHRPDLLLNDSNHSKE